MALLWRVAPEPILCFDGDAAGQRAAFRSIDRALPKIGIGRTLRFAALPDKLDPDDLIRRDGPDAMHAALDAATALSEMLWRRELDREPLDTPERRAGLRTRLRAAVKEIADKDVRDAYAQDIKARLDALYGDSSPQPREWKPGGSRQAWGQGASRPAKVFNRHTGKWELPLKASSQLRALPPGSRIRPDRRVRDILLEAVRRPHLLMEGAEMLANLDIPDDDLDSLRNALLTHVSGEAIDLVEVRRHLLERGSISAAALLQRFSELAEESPDAGSGNSAIDDERWLQALSSAVQASELERDAAEAKAAVATGVIGAALNRHSRIAAERRGEAEQDVLPDRSKGRMQQQESDPIEAPADDADEEFGDYGSWERELGDEGEN